MEEAGTKEGDESAEAEAPPSPVAVALVAPKTPMAPVTPVPAMGLVPVTAPAPIEVVALGRACGGVGAVTLELLLRLAAKEYSGSSASACGRATALMIDARWGLAVLMSVGARICGGEFVGWLVCVC